MALEFAINWPERVASMVLISSTFDKSQLLRLKKVGRPTLIIWAEDDLVAQVKAGYVLRDAIRTAKIQVLDPVAKNPQFDFTIAHKLERYRKDVDPLHDQGLPLRPGGEDCRASRSWSRS